MANGAHALDLRAAKPKYTIDADIPLSDALVNRTYPFADMGVGDSFFIGTSPERSRVVSAAAHHALRYQKKFSIRAVDGGWRCWRVA